VFDFFFLWSTSIARSAKHVSKWPDDSTAVTPTKAYGKTQEKSHNWDLGGGSVHEPPQTPVVSAW